MEDELENEELEEDDPCDECGHYSGHGRNCSFNSNGIDEYESE